MALYLRQRWRRQPQGPVAVDWGNPLARGLKAAFDLRTVRDLVTQTGPSLDTASTVVNQQGVGKTFSSTTTTQFAHRSNYALTGPMTAFVLADINTLSNYTPFISKEQNATTNVAYQFRCGVSNATGSELVLFEATAAGQIAIWNSPKFTVSAGFRGSVAFTRDSGIVNGGNRNFFANGKKFSGTLTFSNGSTSIGDDGASAVIFGGRVDRLDGRVYLANLWDRALSDSEIAALSDNPWQLFRAPRPILYSLPTNYSRPVQDVYNPNNNTTGNASKIIGAGAVAQFLPRRWRQQPQGPVAVDWGNPLARGLNDAFIGNNLTVNLARANAAPTLYSSGVSLPLLEPGAGGVGWKLNGTSGVAEVRPNPWVNAGSYWTQFALFTQRSATTSSISTIYDGAASLTVDRSITIDSSGVLAGYIYDGGTVTLTGAKATPLGKLASAALRVRPNVSVQSLDLFCDGRLDGAVSCVSAGFNAFSNPILALGTNAYRGLVYISASAVTVYAFGLWTRTLSDSEIAALSENPWQLFKPRKQIIYVPQTGWTRIP